MYRIVYWFGSPFAGHVCDDGPRGTLGNFPLDVAKERLRQFCKRQRCIATVSEDGMGATFENWSGSTTGGAVIEKVEYSPSGKQALPSAAGC